MALIQDATGVYTLAINAAGQAPIIDAKFPTAAAAADNYANPTITHEGADGMLFNNSTWDRARNNFVTTADSSAARTATVAGATVTASVVCEGKDKKVIVYKYKRKTGYHKKNGHRQLFTKVKIEKINA